MDTSERPELAAWPNGLPRSLATSFQEYQAERLDLDRDADVVVERTLAYGDRHEVRWLCDHYGRDRIVTWIERMGSRRLPFRRFNLWCVIFGLPPAERLRPVEARIWPH